MRSACHVVLTIQITWLGLGGGVGQGQGMAEGLRFLLAGDGQWKRQVPCRVRLAPCVRTDRKPSAVSLRLTGSHTLTAPAPLQPCAQTCVSPIKLRTTRL